MRLLLVEDDVMVASGIKLGLCHAGYAVDWVGSAERALDAAKSGVNSVHIIDGRVPHALLLEMLTEQAFGTMIRSH